MGKLSALCTTAKRGLKKAKGKVRNGAVDVINYGIEAYSNCPLPLSYGVLSGLATAITSYVIDKDPFWAIMFGVNFGLLGAVIGQVVEVLQQKKEWTGKYI